MATCGSSSTLDTWILCEEHFRSQLIRNRASVGAFMAVSATQPPACLKSALCNDDGVNGDVSRLFICDVNCFIAIVALFQNMEIYAKTHF